MRIYGFLKKYRGVLENQIHRFEPRAVMPSSELSWTKSVEELHPLIKSECLTILQRLSYIPNFDQVLPGQRALNQGDQWKSFYLVALGRPISAHAEHCPETMRALQNVPGLMNAFFSILKPGTHIPAHRGPYSGILRYHLGVVVPQGDVGIRVGHDICRWQEGQSLVFDDGFEHEAWNRSEQLRVVLFVDLVRPLPAPLSFVNRGVLRLMCFSHEVRKAQRVIESTQIGRDLKGAPSIL
jgi:beta-hydroxylase